MALAAGGCGGGASARQDVSEPAGTYRLSIVRASFPARQHVAQPARLVLEVRNDGRATVPNLAVTVDSFGERSKRAGLADPTRPVWVVDRAPAGGTTAYTNTWALGPLVTGRTKRIEWRLTPVRTGTHRVRLRLAAGLNGRAKAVLAGNRSPQRALVATISARPVDSRVDPETGAVVRGGG
jgi:hypothetical protein